MDPYETPTHLPALPAGNYVCGCGSRVAFGQDGEAECSCGRHYALARGRKCWCGYPVAARGLCATHLAQQRSGDMPPSPIERLQAEGRRQAAIEGLFQILKDLDDPNH